MARVTEVLASNRIGDQGEQPIQEGSCLTHHGFKNAAEILQYWSDLAAFGQEPFSVYALAIKGFEELKLLEKYTTTLKRKENERGVLVALKCPSCSGFIVNPTCLPCGHSSCKLCIEKSYSGGKVTCAKCQTFWSDKSEGGKTRSQTVLLANTLAKCFPAKCKAFQLKEDGNKFTTSGDFPLAYDHYTESLKADPQDHRVYSNRSKALMMMDRYDEALSDATECCVLSPFWCKAHHRRASALLKKEQFLEAAAEYFLCLYLGGNDCNTVKQLCQLLKRFLSEKNESDKDDNTYIMSQELLTCAANIMEYLVHQYLSLPSQPSGSKGDMMLIEEREFECVLCMSVLLNPVTTDCGHTFCRDCLSRNFDHTPTCPICRSSLTEMFSMQLCGKLANDSLMDQFVRHSFSKAVQQKEASYQVIKDQREKIGLSDEVKLPIFTCTFAFPGIPCPLHIFEPKYRLLIRRCMESSRRFGMCAYNEETGTYQEYGTVLHIESVQYTSDGRSLVTTLGEKRFQILERTMEDGLDVARIAFVSDELPDSKFMEETLILEEEVYEHCKLWFGALPQIVKLCLFQSVCLPFPTIRANNKIDCGYPSWLWWFASAIPLSVDIKIDLLKSASCVNRLKILRDALPLPGGVIKNNN